VLQDVRNWESSFNVQHCIWLQKRLLSKQMQQTVDQFT
jgi:hypothetical protein